MPTMPIPKCHTAMARQHLQGQGPTCSPDSLCQCLPSSLPVRSPDGTAHLKSAVFRCLHASHQLLGTISPCSLLVLAPRAAIPAAVPALPQAGLVERLPPCSSTGPASTALCTQEAAALSIERPASSRLGRVTLCTAGLPHHFSI